MGKYKSYEEFSENAPKNWAENTDPSKYEEGLNRIAPPGMKVKKARVKAYGDHTTEKEAKKWLNNYVNAVFEKTS